MTHRSIFDADEADYTFGKALEKSASEEKDWDESKHPRDPKGEFSESGGGESDGDVYSKEEPDKYGLNAVEHRQLRQWMGNGYTTLRTDSGFGKILEKLPKVSGRVFRGTRVKREDLAKLKPGAVYRIEKFSSSSQRRDVAEGFMSPAMHPDAKKVPVFFEIDDSARKIPKPIAEEAGTEDEAEVVLMRGGRYAIKEIKEEKFSPGSEKTFLRVKMSEVHA